MKADALSSPAAKAAAARETERTQIAADADATNDRCNNASALLLPSLAALVVAALLLALVVADLEVIEDALAAEIDIRGTPLPNPGR